MNEAFIGKQDAHRQIEDIETVSARLTAAHRAIGDIVLGQESVIEQSLIALLAGGHALLVGMPGLGKTRLTETLATVLGLDNRRIQFTPDVMPGDILGSEVLEEGAAGQRSFRFLPGPIFCQLLMADEINRASPRTQSALLQAMQEHKIAVAGHNRPLPAPFHVLATQNPIEQEGTYPLPEAQLDRFLMQIDVDYPDRNAERRMLLATTGANPPQARQLMTATDLQTAQALVRRLPVGRQVVEAVLTLVRSGRPEDSPLEEVRHRVAWGPGPRASQALMLAIRAKTLLDGRLAPSLDDVIALAAPILRHRMALTFAARAEGIGMKEIIDQLIASIA